jgi:Outer membrane protein beta-barrel domain
MSTRRVSTFLFVAVSVLAGVSRVAAQEATLGSGKLEIGLFPMGGTFFVGGDDDEEVDFNVYTFGGGLTYYLTPRVAVEGELGISLGLAQDITFQRETVFHVQMPNVWSYFGNVVFFPTGSAGKRFPFYVTGGVGLVQLQSREPTRQFGYDVDTNPWETFVAENIGGGIKIFRSTSDWGFRVDYRYLIVNSNEDAPAFFAKSKTRGGHRINFGVLLTLNR